MTTNRMTYERIGTMSITEFLTARIAEDEAWATRADQLGEHEDTDRLRRECAAKQKIVELHEPWRHAPRGLYCPICDAYEATEGNWSSGDLYPCETIRTLASIWSDHPDFDPAWRM